MTETEDWSLPEVTDETLQGALQHVRPYTLVILKAGPRYSRLGPDRDPTVEQIIWEHGKRNFALRAAGLMPIVCPVVDESDVAGIGIFDAGHDEVDRIMSRDPGVRAGLFTYDIHPVLGFSGSALPEGGSVPDMGQDTRGGDADQPSEGG